MKATTKRKLVLAWMLLACAVSGGVVGWVGGAALLGFWLGWLSSILCVLGVIIRQDMLVDDTYAEAHRVLERAKAQLN